MFDWARYLVLAQDLVVQRSDDEASLRCAGSRAYYAAFCMASTLVFPNGRPDSTGIGSHALVWKTYKKAAEQITRKLAEDGFRLKRWRVTCDYDGSADITLAQTRLQIALAQSVLERLNSIPPTGIRALTS